MYVKTITRITAVAGVALGGVLVATAGAESAQAAPHPSPTAYTHASTHAKFKRPAPPVSQCDPQRGCLRVIPESVGRVLRPLQPLKY